MDKVKRSYDTITKYSVDYLVPCKIYNGKLSWGSEGDSYYEYLLKTYLLTNKKEDVILLYFRC